MTMRYDFDEIVDRRHTDCLKYEMVRQQTGRDDLLPLWVADMDFRTPPFILRTISERLQQGILGYPFKPARYDGSIISWLGRRHGFSVEAEAIHYLPGIVPGLAFAVAAFTEKGDGVLIQPPVYHPFHHVVTTSGRRLVESPLKLTEAGRYEMDFDDLESKLPECRLMLLCNPHNPGGFTWPAHVLERLAELCDRYGVTVVSDEIHADLTLPGHRHTPFATVSPVARRISLTMMAPSKAFNMPGVVAAYCVVSDAALCERYFSFLDGNDLAFGNIFGYEATVACYSEEGEDWLNQMLQYVDANIDFTRQYLADHCPGVSMLRPEASFLVFLDNRGLGLGSQRELVDFYEQQARLFLNDGSMFGREAEGFMRLNVATPRAILAEALGRLSEAVSRLS